MRGPQHNVAGYEIDNVLGQGAMGIVHAARQTGTGRPVAIKWLSSRALDARPSARQRFEREASMVGKLASAHIVEVIETSHDERGHPFIVMERLEGEDLQALLHRVGPLVPATALRIAAQACEGLDVAHKAGILHRDIKPANLFLSRSNMGEVIVKILDFGIAKIRPGHPDSMARIGEHRTTTGRVMGSPYFLSPEQLHGQPDIDERCDIFSLGVTLYTMLTGKLPFPDMKSFVKFLLHATSTPPGPVREAAPWVSAPVSAIVKRATRIERENRFSNARAMHDAIRKVLRDDIPLHEDMLRGVHPPG
jgi:serine/threonine-protein kinase